LLWNVLNTSLSRKVVVDTPVAISCNHGPQYNAKTCVANTADLANQAFILDNPIALSYPTESVGRRGRGQRVETGGGKGASR